MPAPVFRPRHDSSPRAVPQASPHNELIDRILERVQRDLPDSVGLAVTVHAKGDAAEVLAARGLRVDHLAGPAGEGPLADAVEHQVPVLSPDLWSDDRWPGLTVESVRSRFGDGEDLSRVRGLAAVPGVWRAGGTVVLSCVLSRDADASTVTTLIGYEQLLAAALMTSAAEDASGIADMLAVLQSRGAIEQAKGVIMGCLRCDADTAWSTLRRASHESNVKLRSLSVALVEHVGGKPAEQPETAAPILPDERARKAAALLWAVLSHASRPEAPEAETTGTAQRTP